MSFIEFKTACKIACHERGACKEGYAAMLRAETYPELLQVWRNNLPDIVGSKYADFIVRELEPYYIEDRQEFNHAGFYFNESTDTGLCIITDTDNEIFIGGGAEAYVLGKAKVTAEGISKLYNKTAQDAHVTLQGYSVGYIDAGELVIRSRATAYTSVDAECYEASRVHVHGNATLTTHGHRQIFAYNNSRVVSWTYSHIDLFDKASIVKI